MIARPLTYPKGILAIGVDIINNTKTFFDPALIRPSVGYGITDDLELEIVGYAFPTSEAGKGDIFGGVGYKLIRGAVGGKLEIIARVRGGYNLLAEALDPLVVGVHVQYNFTPKIAVITNALGFAIGLEKPNSIGFDVPLGIGFQPIPKLYLQLDTKLAHIKIKDDANVFPGDFTPINLTAIYNAMPALDVIAGFGLDATPVDPAKVGDTLTVLVGARYYIGKL